MMSDENPPRGTGAAAYAGARSLPPPSGGGGGGRGGAPLSAFSLSDDPSLPETVDGIESDAGGAAAAIAGAGRPPSPPPLATTLFGAFSRIKDSLPPLLPLPQTAAAAVAALRQPPPPAGLPPGPARPPTLVLVGDSLTEDAAADAAGWAHPLVARYARRADVLVRGYNGYNSRWLLRLLPPLLSALSTANVRLVTLFVGANDAVADGAAQAVPLAEFVDNLARLVGAVRRAGAAPLLIGPPPCSGSAWAAACAARGRGDGDGRGVTLSRTYARAVVRVAERLRVPPAHCLWAYPRCRASATRLARSPPHPASPATDLVIAADPLPQGARFKLPLPLPPPLLPAHPAFVPPHAQAPSNATTSTTKGRVPRAKRYVRSRPVHRRVRWGGGGRGVGGGQRAPPVTPQSLSQTQTTRR
ncbi:hypothetical protein I4F81_006504 [Pyropia yezoensis]|uniref:Uncharacterized protein n=1 Tax=Pyropia yezoensis TaxID=2788 RepID=A0ACC3C2C6_PYRYE|nr:hypothetical protein I4F81_006504 [Neopyropia yezoensis]